MIRLTELKLPLDHTTDALSALVIQTLGVAPGHPRGFTVFKHSIDARKAALVQVYIVDADLCPGCRSQLLQQFANNPHIFATPDMTYHPVVQAPADLTLRPVVVGFGPCGLFAALALAQMGFKPIVLERGKPVRERTKDTWGLWRKKVLNPQIQRAVRRRRRRPVLRRQALQPDQGPASSSAAR